MMKMLSSSLSVGDRISVKAWFGWTDMLVKIQGNRLMASTVNGDVVFPLSSLSFTSREHTTYSKWKYLGKPKEVEAQYIEYEEEGKEGDEKEGDLLDNFLNMK